MLDLGTDVQPTPDAYDRRLAAVDEAFQDAGAAPFIGRFFMPAFKGAPADRAWRQPRAWLTCSDWRLCQAARLMSRRWPSMLPKVMTDLADLLEQEDEVRGEVVAAVAYPAFVLGFGFVTVAVLLTVVMPKLFSMLTEMATTLPLPTLILLRASGFVQDYWIPLVAGTIGALAGLRWYLRSPRGAEKWDAVKLRLPVLGGVYRAAALSRFARTLGTLAKSGVSLLPALKIVENTIGNLVLGKLIAQVAEETRGGDSLATPLRKLGIFPKTVVQMISVGEESGMLAEMLLQGGRHRGTPHAGAHQDAGFPARAGLDSGGGRAGRLHGDRAPAPDLQHEPGP